MRTRVWITAPAGPIAELHPALDAAAAASKMVERNFRGSHSCRSAVYHVNSGNVLTTNDGSRSYGS
eukprot:7163444-Pyramimonas_sp.AAC.1